MSTIFPIKPGLQDHEQETLLFHEEVITSYSYRINLGGLGWIETINTDSLPQE